MKKIFLLFLILFNCFSFVVAQTPADDKNWDITTLPLNDNFTTFNSGTWTAMNATWPATFDFDANCVTTGSNNLILSSNNNFTTGKPHHVGGLISNNTYSCGYFEINCQLQCLGGSYMPAFWTMYKTDTPSSCFWRELDFFETTCKSNNFDVTGNWHYEQSPVSACGTNHISAGTQDYFINSNTWYTSFHTLGCEWTPGRLIFYLDGQAFRYLSSQYIDETFQKLWINIGFSEGLLPNGEFPDAAFPGYMNVKNVKVYNLKWNCIDENVSNFNSGTYNFSSKKSITISGTSNVLSGDKATLRAQDGIQISGDFTVPLGSELTLLPTNCY